MSLLVVSYLGLVIHVTAIPIDLKTCRADLPKAIPVISAAFVAQGFNKGALDIRCAALGSVRVSVDVQAAWGPQ